MKVSVLVCLLHTAFPSVAAAFVPRTTGVSLQFLGAIGKKTPTPIRETNAEYPIQESDTSTVSAEPVPSAEPPSEVKTKIFSELLLKNEVQVAASVFFGTVSTFALNNCVSLGPIKASSLVGMLSALILPEKMALASLCGSFSGMARQTVIPGVYASVALGALCAAMMALFDKKKWLVGVGGRLGFIAQLACTSQFLVSSLFMPTPGASFVGAYPPVRRLLAQVLPTCFFTVAGTLLMSAWKEIFSGQSKKTRFPTSVACISKRLSTPVAAVSATGLGMSLFPVSVAGPAFCGSFIAMSSPLKLETYGGLVGASLVGGLCQILLAGVLLGGWGGKLGTASLMGVLLYKKVLETTRANLPTLVKAE